MKKNIFFSILFLTLFSCTKENPYVNADSADPVFTMRGTFGGNEIEYEAGVNSVLATSHDTLLDFSMFNSSFIVDQSLSGGLGDFNLDIRLSGGVENLSANNVPIGLVAENVQVDFLDVINGDYIDIGFWIVNGEIGNNLAMFEGIGVYDVDLVFQSAGESYILKNRLVLGGVEYAEPEINIIDLGNGVYQFQNTNKPIFIDSVAWFLDSGIGQFTPVSDPETIFLSDERHVILCEYYDDGELINYGSMMYGPNVQTPIIDLNSLFSDLNLQSISADSKAQISIQNNGVLYTSLGQGQTNTLNISNVSVYSDPFTNEELIKGNVALEIWLHASPLDSLLLDVEGVIGIKRYPD